MLRDLYEKLIQESFVNHESNRNYENQRHQSMFSKMRMKITMTSPVNSKDSSTDHIMKSIMTTPTSILMQILNTCNYFSLI